MRPLLWVAGLVVLVGGACTQSYDDFDFSGPTAPPGGTGGTTTTSHGGAGATGGGGTSAGGAAGSGAAGGMGGQGGACNFSAPNDCSSATDLGTVGGDTGHDTLSHDGIGSLWLQVLVSETAGLNHPLSYTVSLTSPVGGDYDLYVSEGGQDGPDCGATPVQGTGDPESVSNGWQDSQMGVGNDGRTLSIEVRYVSGTDCDTPWHLTVTGHTPWP